MRQQIKYCILRRNAAVTSQDALDFTVIIGNSDIIKKNWSCKHDGQITFVKICNYTWTLSFRHHQRKNSKKSFVYNFYYEINIDLHIL